MNGASLMNRLTIWMALLAIVLVVGANQPKANAQISYSIIPSDISSPRPKAALAAQSNSVIVEDSSEDKAVVLETTAHNATRTSNALVLFDVNYGMSTRTNPYGVEVVAKPVQGVPNTYQITDVESIWQCQKKHRIDHCGNSKIPVDGIVLSASDGMRAQLLEAFGANTSYPDSARGKRFTLKKNWFDSASLKVKAINPGMHNNPLSCGFPGCRGGNQLVVYTREYPKQSTTTNEYGFEVTVVNGVVVAQEGSDSTIPHTGENSFVASGHGAARNWLIKHAPIGAKLSVQLNTHESDESLTKKLSTNPEYTLTSNIDMETYLYQIQHTMDSEACRVCGAESLNTFKHTLRDRLNQAQSIYHAGRTDEAMEIITNALDGLKRHSWAEHHAFPASSVKGVWHRPVEMSPLEIGETLDYLNKGGFNTVFLETYFHGYPIFPSDTFKKYGIALNQYPKYKAAYTRPGWDYLKTWIEEAHQRNMKIHVWFETFYTGSDAVDGAGPVLAKYPEWANVQYSALSKAKNGIVPPTPSTVETKGYFLDPANPEVQSFLLDLIREISLKYDIDGFQLDYIRYPNSFPEDRYSYYQTTWGYTPIAMEGFKNVTGIDILKVGYKRPSKMTTEELASSTNVKLWQQWNDYKASQVSHFVKRVNEEFTQIQRVKGKKLPLSAVIFANLDQARIQKHQDWITWGKQGWIDFLAPITLTSAPKVIEEDTERVVRLTGGRVPVVSGLFGAFNNNTAEQLLDQVDIAKDSGASGYAVFDSAHLTGRMVQALEVSQNKK